MKGFRLINRLLGRPSYDRIPTAEQQAQFDRVAAQFSEQVHLATPNPFQDLPDRLQQDLGVQTFCGNLEDWFPMLKMAFEMKVPRPPEGWYAPGEITAQDIREADFPRRPEER